MSGPRRPGLGVPEGEEAHPRPTGKETAAVRKAEVEAEARVKLAAIEADTQVKLAKIAAEDVSPEKEPPSKTIRTLGVAIVGIIAAIGLVIGITLAILYNVDFEGNPLTGTFRVGGSVEVGKPAGAP